MLILIDDCMIRLEDEMNGYEIIVTVLMRRLSGIIAIPISFLLFVLPIPYLISPVDLVQPYALSGCIIVLVGLSVYYGVHSANDTASSVQPSTIVAEEWSLLNKDLSQLTPMMQGLDGLIQPSPRVGAQVEMTEEIEESQEDGIEQFQMTDSTPLLPPAANGTIRYGLQT